MNQKAVAAKAKKDAAQAIKDADSARQAESATAADWGRGSNARGAARADAAASKADEAARKRAEKAALLAEEEEAAGSGKTIKPKKGAASKKKGGKKKKNDDFSLLEDALVGDAEKKSKEKKKSERIKKEREASAAAEREKKGKEDQAKRDPLMANTDAMLGMAGDEDDAERSASMSSVGRAANVASMAELQASGLDSALSAMAVGEGRDERHPEKRRKAAYEAYKEKMMPEMKQQYPGMKRQQYLDKIFTAWKKSPENPMNQQ